MRQYRVEPARGPLDADVSVPGSKSIANRALVCAALAGGTSVLRNVPGGEDTIAMLDCLERLGVGVERSRSRVTVHGTGGRFVRGPVVLPARLAGTTSRFVTALAALGPGPYTVDGEPPLRARPMAPLHDALTALGFDVRPQGEQGHLPVRVGRPRARSLVANPTVHIRGDVSSQYLSALMMIGPHLPGGLRIRPTSAVVSRPYLVMTQSVMSTFGHKGVRISAREITVAPGSYAPCDYAVERDATSASYPFAAAAIAGGRVRVDYPVVGSAQGDSQFPMLLGEMGCNVDLGATYTEVARARRRLRGIEVDLRDMSDCAPTLAAVAAVASTATRVTGIGFIRAKESDRIGDVVRELQRCGVRAVAEPDGFVVRPSTPHGASIATYHDHRIAMSFALLGLVTPGMVIENPGVVRKSFPGYWTMLERLAQ